MKAGAGITPFLLAVVGCAAPPTPGDPEWPVWKDEPIVGWRLTQRSYGSIDDFWANAGDGRIPPGQAALVYEPIYRDEEAEAPSFESKLGFTCSHRLVLVYDGALSQGVGTPVEMRFWIKGISQAAHLIEISGSRVGIVILEVQGALPLAEETDRYVLDTRVVGSVIFTSRTAGRGGIKFRVVGEVAGPAGDDASLVRHKE